MDFDQPICQEIFARKYMINDEKNADDVFVGIAKEIASCEKNKEEIEKIFLEQMVSGKFIPAGRILANARPESKLKNYNNCFTIDLEDSMESIYNSLKEDALISKMGGGVGFNISKLRPKGDTLSKGGESSGPISFLRVFNESAKIIMTGGQRRAAHICILNIDHPDIEEFITVKQGNKNNELTQFNISVGITDEFMKAVEENGNFDLKWNGKVYKTVVARDLYNLMVKNAFEHNEPGIFNLDEAEKYNNGYWGFKIDRTNPCGEICVSGDAKIQTKSHGILTLDKLIDQINDGDFIEVLSYNEKMKSNEYCLVLAGQKTQESANVITLEIEENKRVYKITCTPDHLIYTKNRGYIEAQKLTDDDDIVVSFE